MKKTDPVFIRHILIFAVICIAFDNPTYAVTGYELGVSGFLPKPLMRDKVHETLKRLLSV